MDASLPLNVRQLVFLLGAYLPRIGFADLAATLKVEAQSEEEHTVTLGNMGLGIDTGWAMKVPALGGCWDAKGYRVFSVVTHGASRWHPEEAEDKTEFETVAMHVAIEQVGALLARFVASNLPDLPEELAGEQAVLEEV